MDYFRRILIGCGCGCLSLIIIILAAWFGLLAMQS